MEKENSVLVVQLIKLDNIIGDLSSNVTYSSEEVDFCISSFMENRGKLEVKTEPLALLVPMKIENEKDLSICYIHHNINEHNNTESNFIQESIKEEFYDEISDMHKSCPLALSGGKNGATNFNENDFKRNYLMAEHVLEKINKTENESINEFKHSELIDAKQNIDLKENIIESLIVKSNVTSTSVYEDGNKHGSIRNIGGEATSVSDARNFCVHEEKGKIKEKLKQIRHLHSEIKNYECYVCKKSFIASRGLQRHNNIIHKGIKNKCEVCRKCFTDLGKLQVHLEIVHNKIKKNECQKCKKAFASSRNLKKHISSIHEGIKYECEECKKSFTQLCHLKTHISSIHEGIKYKCEKCRKCFTQLGHLKTHIKSIHEGIKYKCEECRKCFTPLGYLRRHIETVHSRIRKYECGNCKKTFTALGSLKTHINSIHREIKYRCAICKKCFTDLGKLQVHLEILHSEARKYECQKCKKIFTRSDRLKMHIQ